MAESIQNMGASVRSRLLNLSRSTGRPFETLLVHYALERLLYRLTRTEHAERFVLKGAMPLRPASPVILNNRCSGGPSSRT